MPNYIDGGNRITIDIIERLDNITLIGPGPIMSCLSFTGDTLLSQAGTWEARFPANDPMLARVQIKRHILRFYYDDTLIFYGLTENSREEVGNDGQRYLILSGRDTLGELDETSIDFAYFQLGPAAITTAPYLAIAAYNQQNLFTQWGNNTEEQLSTDTPVYLSVAGESCLSVLTRIAESVGESFRLAYRPNEDNDPHSLTWLGNSLEDSAVRAIQGAGDPVAAENNPLICYIQKLTESRNAKSMMTDIVPFGSGFGDTRLDLLGTTRPPEIFDGGNLLFSYNPDDNSIRSWDAYDYVGKVIKRHVSFKDIRPLANTDDDILTAKNYLYDCALAYLQRNDSVDDSLSYELEVIALPPTVRVGMTIRVIYQDDRYDLDRDLVILGIRRQIDSDGAITYTLTVSTVNQWKLRDTHTLVASVDEGEILIGHPQIDANVYWENFREIIGTVNDGDIFTHTMAEIPFFLAEEVVTIRQVIFLCKVEPVLTYAKTYTTGANTLQNLATETGDPNAPNQSTGGVAVNTSNSALVTTGTQTPLTSAGVVAGTVTAGQTPTSTTGAAAPNLTSTTTPGITDPPNTPNTSDDSVPDTDGISTSNSGDQTTTPLTTSVPTGSSFVDTNAGDVGEVTEAALSANPATHFHAIAQHQHQFSHQHTVALHHHNINHSHSTLALHHHTLNAHTHSHVNHPHQHTMDHGHTISHTHTIAHTHNIAHAHDVTHSHPMPHTHLMPHKHNETQHTHPLPALVEAKGVIRVAASESMAITDLEYLVNSTGSWANLADGVPIAGGFYSFDITGNIQNSDGLRRPRQEYNLIQVRRKTSTVAGRTSAMIRVKIGIRSTIQSVVIYG